MCGICGFTGNRYNDEYNTVIQTMTDKIIHRGPDGQGLHVDDNISLGFRRLAFLDAEHGGQPMYNEDRTLALVCNGEIYNFEALRETLITNGHTFGSRADSEVLLHLYEEYGVEMLHHLRGMFAFVIYDLREKRLFAARDFFGIKPFYYTLQDGEIVFASEIKSILEYPGVRWEVNPEALEQYLSFQYSVLPETFFKGVYKLPPAHYLCYQYGEVAIEKYWDMAFMPDESITLEQAVDEIDRVMKDSVAHHQTSDTPLGSFLSSGVDSSYLAATFEGDKTFSVGFGFDEYNETEHASALAAELGLENHRKIISADEFFASLEKVQYHMDEPLADPAAIALYFVSGLAGAHVKGVFSGEGADELFGGYNIYKDPLNLRLITWLPLPIRRLLGQMAKILPKGIKGRGFLTRASQTVEERFIGNANIFSEEEKREILCTPKT